jgi:hypothetical protein
MPSHFVPNQTYASIHWDNGKEVCCLPLGLRPDSQITQIRIYYLEHGNILQEYAYSSTKAKRWYCGDLSNLNIILHETSSIAATLHGNTIYVFYQGWFRDFILEHPTK